MDDSVEELESLVGKWPGSGREAVGERPRKCPESVGEREKIRKERVEPGAREI